MATVLIAAITFVFGTVVGVFVGALLCTASMRATPDDRARDDAAQIRSVDEWHRRRRR
jgi:hypothetical protein